MIRPASSTTRTIRILLRLVQLKRGGLMPTGGDELI